MIYSCKREKGLKVKKESLVPSLTFYEGSVGGWKGKEYSEKKERFTKLQLGSATYCNHERLTQATVRASPFPGGEREEKNEMGKRRPTEFIIAKETQDTSLEAPAPGGKFKCSGAPMGKKKKGQLQGGIRGGRVDLRSGIQAQKRGGCLDGEDEIWTYRRGKTHTLGKLGRPGKKTKPKGKREPKTCWEGSSTWGTGGRKKEPLRGRKKVGFFTWPGAWRRGEKSNRGGCIEVEGRGRIVNQKFVEAGCKKGRSIYPQRKKKEGDLRKSTRGELLRSKKRLRLTNNPLGWKRQRKGAKHNEVENLGRATR